MHLRVACTDRIFVTLHRQQLDVSGLIKEL